MNIYLVRHGQSEANVDKRIHHIKPDHAIDLTGKGLLQAREAGRVIAKDLVEGSQWYARGRMRIWVSPYARTRQTASEILHELGAVVKPEPDVHEHINLCEQQFGLFDGIEDEDLAAKFPVEHAHYALAEKFEGKFWARMPMGESRFDVAVRVHQSFGTFLRDEEKHGIKNIVVVCHGVTMRAFIMQWLHKPYEWFEAEPNPGNCSVYRIQDGRGSWLFQPEKGS